MSKAEKREQRIRENTCNVSLEEFEALINRYGHIKTGGDHPKAIIGNTMFPYKWKGFSKSLTSSRRGDSNEGCYRQ